MGPTSFRFYYVVEIFLIRDFRMKLTLISVGLSYQSIALQQCAGSGQIRVKYKNTPLFICHKLLSKSEIYDH